MVGHSLIVILFVSAWLAS